MAYPAPWLFTVAALLLCIQERQDLWQYAGFPLQSRLRVILRSMELCLVPLMGHFHLRFPGYNAVSVRDVVAASAPEALAITPLAAGSLESPAWQDTDELALAMAVIPWADRQRLPLYPVLEPSPDPTALRDFRRYLEQYPGAQSLLLEVDEALRPLNALLAESLNLERIYSELLPLLRQYQDLREQRFEDGPGTDWLRQRTGVMAQRILALSQQRVTVLTGIDHLPFLQEALKDKAELLTTPTPEPSEEALKRGFLDFAMRTDLPEPGNVIARLRDMTEVEARYHEANLLLANGHAAEALELLEAASHDDFSQPHFLPGYLLARLGQLRDLAKERDAALRAYRGVLALDWAPREALETARAGLEAPFTISASRVND